MKIPTAGYTFFDGKQCISDSNVLKCSQILQIPFSNEVNSMKKKISLYSYAVLLPLQL